MNTITPFLWFEGNAEEAVRYYVSVFKNAKIVSTVRYPAATQQIPGAPKPGSVMTLDFELEGQKFVALNGGKMPGFEFSPAISFQVDCHSQEEIDHYWEKLSAVPEAEQCGWCKDAYGITWQIVPAVLAKMMADPDKAKVERVTAAFLPMKKMDIAALEKAYSDT